ncbi:hypothetical protein GCM10010399_92170 [Dactylosporangium fulvum]|uniref:PH domain-containing protein n=1 Tax=Dactylosporangium fulvum TaxID=53359 RepID=A0ABY5VNF1_9ACTN|nr:hypothetical protein [Dactylosporangium fulvum]UWP78627.1 hypothetical protein Dfulv_25965 [Dactylosporangium fulvum]
MTRLRGIPYDAVCVGLLVVSAVVVLATSSVSATVPGLLLANPLIWSRMLPRRSAMRVSGGRFEVPAARLPPTAHLVLLLACAAALVGHRGDLPLFGPVVWVVVTALVAAALTLATAVVRGCGRLVLHPDALRVITFRRTAVVPWDTVAVGPEPRPGPLDNSRLVTARPRAASCCRCS